jgi:hypothetical protein
VRLTRLSGCYGGSCPTIYATDRGTVVVQGRLLTDSEFTTPDAIPAAGEALVEIPAELLAQARLASSPPTT